MAQSLFVFAISLASLLVRFGVYLFLGLEFILALALVILILLKLFFGSLS